MTVAYFGIRDSLGACPRSISDFGACADESACLCAFTFYVAYRRPAHKNVSLIDTQ